MAHQRAARRIAQETPWTTGYRVGLALLLGLLVCLVLGCGSLWQEGRPLAQGVYVPQSSTTAVAVQPTQVGPAQSITDAPTGQVAAPLTPVLRLEPTPTPTAVRVLKPTPADTAFSLLILHTNDTRGYVDPCG